jgi:hypothetical protein
VYRNKRLAKARNEMRMVEDPMIDHKRRETDAENITRERNPAKGRKRPKQIRF